MQSQTMFFALPLNECKYTERLKQCTNVNNGNVRMNIACFDIECDNLSKKIIRVLRNNRIVQTTQANY